MLCYESVAKNVIDVAFFFFTIPLFLIVIVSNMIFYYSILANKELTPQQL